MNSFFKSPMKDSFHVRFGVPLNEETLFRLNPFLETLGYAAGGYALIEGVGGWINSFGNLEQEKYIEISASLPEDLTSLEFFDRISRKLLNITLRLHQAALWVKLDDVAYLISVNQLADYIASQSEMVGAP